MARVSDLLTDPSAIPPDAETTKEIMARKRVGYHTVYRILNELRVLGTLRQAEKKIIRADGRQGHATVYWIEANKKK
jgi:Fe2+ or Zn2+ uptake regulation protein